MKKTWKFISLFSAITFAGIAVPAAASAVTESSPSEPEIVIIEAPEFISDAEMDQLSEGSVTLAAPAGGITARKALLCRLDIGDVYKRTSGSPYKYGTVGSKPKTSCTGNVTRIEQSSGVYRKTIAGWGRVAGDWAAASTGVASLTQKNVEYICKGLTNNDFRVATLGAVWYPGKAPVSGGAYEISKGKLPCT